MYGKREGVVTGLAITHNSKNHFHGTRAWKTGTIHGVQMCPRSEMFKREQATWLGLMLKFHFPLQTI